MYCHHIRAREDHFPTKQHQTHQTFTYLLDIHVESILNGEKVVSAVIFELPARKISRIEVRYMTTVHIQYQI